MTTATLVKPMLTSRKPAIRSHKHCPWCSRLIYHDRRTRPTPVFAPTVAHDHGFSSGLCRVCFDRLMATIPGSDAPGGDLMSDERVVNTLVLGDVATTFGPAFDGEVRA